MRSLAVLALAGSALAGTALQATDIDFRTLPAYTSVTNQFAGVTFSLSGGDSGGDPQIAYYTGWSPASGGLSNTHYGGAYPTANQLVATFSQPVTGVKFIFDNEGYNGGNYYAAFDSSNNLLTSGALDVYDPNNGQFFDLSAYSGISKLIWDNGTGGNYSWTQSLVTLSFNGSAAPEPATWALMIVGIGAVGVSMRRRAKVSRVSFG